MRSHLFLFLTRECAGMDGLLAPSHRPTLGKRWTQMQAEIWEKDPQDPKLWERPGETKVVGTGMWEVGSKAQPLQTSEGQSRERVGRGRTLDPPHPPRLAWKGPQLPSWPQTAATAAGSLKVQQKPCWGEGLRTTALTCWYEAFTHSFPLYLLGWYSLI